MYESLISVPVEIREFYEETTTDEATLISEKPRHDLKNWVDVERVKVKGNTSVISHFITKAIEADNWAQFDRYVEWLGDIPDSDDEKYLLSYEDGYSYDADLLAWEALEPSMTLSTPDTMVAEYVNEEKIEKFKHARQTQLASAVVDVNGLKFDADEISITRMVSAIMAAAGQPATLKMAWSLADTPTGVMTSITLKDLKAAQKLAVENMSSAWGVPE